MRPPFLTLPALVLCVTSVAPLRSADDHASDRAYIRQAESDWAESVVANDVRVLERILADDFIGVEIDGSPYSKADAIQDYRTTSVRLRLQSSQPRADAFLWRHVRSAGQ
jgi:Domain of unknown function (DUF4440)